MNTAYAGKRGAKIININEGINDECLNATEEKIKAKEREEQPKILIKHILMFSSIGLGIIFCIVIIIIEHKKKNKVKKENIKFEK